VLIKNKIWRILLFISITLFATSAVHMACAVGVTSTITVGGAPWGVAYDSGKNEIFVVDSYRGSVLVLSDSYNSLVATVTVGNHPYRAIYDSAKGEIFVANYGDNSVSVISDSTNTVVATIPVGTSPSSFAYDSGRGEIFVANSGGSSVSVISDSTNTVVATIPVGAYPFDLAYDSIKGEVFVSNYAAGTVSVILDSNNTVVTTIPVGNHPLGVAYDYSQAEVFVVNSGDGTVSVISDSTNSVVATVTVGTNPGPIVYDSGTNEIFVANKNSTSVSVISCSTNAVVATIPVGANPYGIAYNSGRGEILVANYGDGTVSVISDSSTTSPSPSPTISPTSSPTPTETPSSEPDVLQQVWVPKPIDTAVSVGVSAVIVGAVSFIFSAISDPLGGAGGALAEKTKDLIPEKIKEWLQEVVSSKRKLKVTEKTGPIFKPTMNEIFAYIVSIVVLAVSFSYVKIIDLSQIWVLLPIFFTTSFVVGFVKKFFSITYLRSKGVWSEHTIWPLGFVLFLFTTFAFKVPFSSPTRSVHSDKCTERLSAIVAASELLISLAFAGLFFLLLESGFTAIGGAGLSMCVLGAFFGVFPISPMSGKEIFGHSKRLWVGLFITTALVFVAWLLLI
jgi:YVTN family beta-propeller protein